MPRRGSRTWDPAGNPYVTRSGAADILGIDQGSMLSTAGTGTGAGSVYVPQEMADFRHELAQ